MKRRIVNIILFFLPVIILTIIFIIDRHNKKIIALKTEKKPIPPTFRYKIDKPGSSQKNYLLLTPYLLSRWYDGQLVIMGMEGHVYFQKNIKGAPFCFRQWDINGIVRFTYLVDDNKAYHIPKISMATGYAVLMDSALNEIRKIRLLPHNDITVNKNEGLDLHDFILLDDEHYIAATTYEKKVTNIPANLKPDPNIMVDVPIIQEVNNGRVVWQWDASSYPELYSASIMDNNFTDTTAKHDYLHINSMFIDPSDSALICSFRHSNQVVKISRKTGEIIWKLGGKNSDFALESEQVFLGQHDAKIADDNETLLLFDNGDSVKRRSSRILEFRLDEKRKIVTGFKAYNIPEPFSLFMGAVEKKGDIYFISGGTGNYLLEINAKTNEKIFEMHSNLALYRAYKIAGIAGIPLSMDQQCVQASADTVVNNLIK